MGCTLSHRNIYQTHPHIIEYRTEFETLGLTKQYIYKLHTLYMKLCRHHETFISVNKIVSQCGQRADGVLHKTFLLLLKGMKTENINFRDMVIVMWYFCTLDDSDVASFLFELYDSDHNGKLDYYEYDIMIKALCGGNSPKTPVFEKLKDRILRQKQLGNTGVTRQFFVDYCTRHPRVVAPMIRLQNQVRSSCLSSSVWKACAARRKEMFSGDYVSLPSFERGLRRGLYSNTLCDSDSSVGGDVDDGESQKERQYRRRKSASRVGRRESVSSTGSATGTGRDSRRGSVSGEEGVGTGRRGSRSDLNGKTKRKRSVGILDIPPPLDLPPPAAEQQYHHSPQQQKEEQNHNGLTQFDEQEEEKFATLNSMNLSRLAVAHVPK